MTYPEAVAYLEGLSNYERTGMVGPMVRTVNLNTMRALLELLGNPEQGQRFVHIAGSKGKGSVAAMVEAMLRAAGYRTGLYTSPHLLTPRERIRIDNQPIAQGDVARWTAALRPAIDEIREAGTLAPVTYFEALTAMAMLHFAASRAEVVVLETGMGGRLDATNLVEPTLCAITRICLEHTAVLGNTLAEIAGEKAGIMRPGVPVVVGPQEQEAREVIDAAARELGAPLVVAPAAEMVEAPVVAPGDEPRPQRLAIGGEAYDLALLGEHQAENAAIAVAVAGALDGVGVAVPQESVAEGLRAVEWPGRLQVVAGRPMVLLDCAHAPAAAAALAASLRRHFRYRRLWMVLGMSSDKNVEGFAEAVAGLRPAVVATAADTPRAVPPEEMAERVAPYLGEAAAAPDVPAALALARDRAAKGDLICVTGSVYVVGEAMVALGLGQADA